MAIPTTMTVPTKMVLTSNRSRRGNHPPRPEDAEVDFRQEVHRAARRATSTIATLMRIERKAAAEEDRRASSARPAPTTRRRRRASDRRLPSPCAAMLAIGSVPPRSPRSSTSRGRVEWRARAPRPTPSIGRLRPIADSHADRGGLWRSAGRAMYCASSTEREPVVREVEVDEGLQRRFVSGASHVRIDEERARQWIAAVGDRVGGRRHASVTGVDLELLHRVAGVLREREPHESEPRWRSLRLDDHVVVGGGLVVGRGAAVLGVLRARPRVLDAGEVDERVVGSRLLARGDDRDRSRRHGAVAPDLLRQGVRRRPVANPSDSGPNIAYRSPMLRHSIELAEFTITADPVERDLELEYSIPLVFAGRDLVLVDRSRGIRDVDLALAEELEPVAGPWAFDGDLHVRVRLVEELGNERGDRLDRR